MWRRFRCVCALGLAVGLLLSGCQPQPLTKSAYALDTYCAVTLQGGREATLDSAMGLLTYYDNLFSATRQGSDIYRLNHAQGQPVAINQETYELLVSASKCMRSAMARLISPCIPSPSCGILRRRGAAQPADRPGADPAGHGPDPPAARRPGAASSAGPDRSGRRADIGMRMAGWPDRSVASGVLDLGGNIQCLGRRPTARPLGIRTRCSRSGCWAVQVPEGRG